MKTLIKILCLSVLWFSCENPTEPKDSESPVVTIISPTNESEVFETIDILFSVSDNSEISSVQLLINGESVQGITEEEGIYSYSWETYNLENNSAHTFFARATDENQNSGQSDIVSVIVNNEGYEPEAVTLDTPTVDGANISLNWNASNDIDFKNYNLYRSDSSVEDFQIVFTDSTIQQIVFTDSVTQDKSYEYYVEVIDNAGLSSQSNHQVVDYSEFIPPSVENFRGEINGLYIDFDWDIVDVSDFESYLLLRSVDNFNSFIDSVLFEDIATDSYSDLVSEVDDYQYKIIVSDNENNTSESDILTFESSEFQPDNIVLYPVTLSGDNISLIWSQNDDVDFNRYELYKSQDGSSMNLFDTINSATDTTYTDVVDQGYDYIYMVSVIDESDLIVNSNTSGIDSEEFIPSNNSLTDLVFNNDDQLTLEWSTNNDVDFAHYLISQSNDGLSFSPLTQIQDQQQTSYSFIVEQGYDYYYKVNCVDIADLQSSDSNVLNINGNQFYPNDITITSTSLDIDTITIEWDYSTDVDFQKFNLLRNDEVIAEITDNSVRNYQDQVTQGSNYTYQIIVVDNADLQNTSNTSTVNDSEFLPNDVSLTSLVTDGESISLNWEHQEEADFLRYDILRNDEVILSIDDVSTNQYQDFPDQGNDYTYYIKVVDNAELSVNSNSLSVESSEFYPNDISLSSISTDGESVLINWEYDVDVDFIRYDILRNDEIIFSIDDSAINQYQDFPEQGNNYTYSIKAVDNGELTSNSNTLSVEGSEFYPPIVNINEITSNGSNAILTWNSINIPDFSQLKVYRYDSDELDDATIVAELDNMNQTTFTDNTVSNQESRYWYQLELIDTGELNAISDSSSYISFYDDIVYLGREDSWDGNLDIWRSEVDGYNAEIMLSNDSFGGGFGAISLSPNAEKLILNSYPNDVYIYDFSSESYEVLPFDTGGLGNAVWENDNVFYVQDLADDLIRYDISSFSTENLGQTRNNTVFDVCNIDNSAYYFSAEGDGNEEYHSFNKYSNGIITELLAFPTPNGMLGLKVLNDCSGFLFYTVGSGNTPFPRGLYFFDFMTNEATRVEIPPYSESPYQIIMSHKDSDYVSDDELFVSINNNNGGGCFYAILNINSQTITELDIECIQNSGDVSVLSDYSKLALQVEYDQGILKIYDNLPFANELYSIDMDLINYPKLIKNKWNSSN